MACRDIFTFGICIAGPLARRRCGSADRHCGAFSCLRTACGSQSVTQQLWQEEMT